MAGVPWSFTVIPDTIDTITITEGARTETISKVGGTFYAGTFVYEVTVSAEGYNSVTAFVGDSVVDFTVQPQTTAQRMGAYIGSQKGSWRIGSQKVAPATKINTGTVHISISDVDSAVFGKTYLNDAQFQRPYSFDSQIGVSYTLVCMTASTIECTIYVDGIEVASGLKTVTYNFTATADMNITIYFSE